MGRKSVLGCWSLCCCLGFALALTEGCGDAGSKAHPDDESVVPPWFVDVSEEVGLDFVHDAGPVGDYFMPQSVGSGCALFDCDGDGLLDIYLVHNSGPKSSSTNRLYRQRPDHHFEDISAGSGLDVGGYSMGVAIGDVNNDGLPDVLLTQYGGIRLFLNLGGGKFEDVTEEAGLHNPCWATSAAFFDYDRDGWLDLVIVNYVDYDPSWPCSSSSGVRDYCGPTVFPGRVSRLFHNLGPGGGKRVRFQDVTVSSGLGQQPERGLGVLCYDFDGDGWPDIFIANDAGPNHLWINKHDGTFREEALLRGLAYTGMGQAWGNMGIALGDVDGDGLMDLFVTHLAEETHTLWRQGPRGSFSDRTAASGLSRSLHRATGFGTVLGDFDQDGALDVALVSGRVSRRTSNNPDLGPHWTWYAEPCQLFANDGSGHFRDLSPSNPAFCSPPRVARGLACGDIDGDGALDLLVATLAGPARLYRNVVPQRGHWLMIRALDPALKRDAYGAEITVRAGNRSWIRLINPANSYLSSSDPRAHFGLGPATNVEGIRVAWPDGTFETFPGGPADRVLTLRKGEGRPASKE